MWFQTECASAYQRLGQFGEALKKCHEVERVRIQKPNQNIEFEVKFEVKESKVKELFKVRFRDSRDSRI